MPYTRYRVPVPKEIAHPLLWFGAKRMAKRHRPHRWATKTCAHCPPGTAWPCAGVRAADRVAGWAMSKAVA